MNRAKQISDSLGLGILLAVAGGFMDAYSYMGRGEVFANAQTGNMLLFGIHLAEGQWQMAFQYFLPVLFFTIGIALSDLVHQHHFGRRLHWRQVAVLIEAVILLGVAFIPLSANLLANALISFACGIQVESFRKIHGRGIATTMCIGNLRSATAYMCTYFDTNEGRDGRASLLYFGIIGCFIFGAVLGNFCVRYFSQYAILLCAVMEGIAFGWMFIDRERIGRH